MSITTGEMAQDAVVPLRHDGKVVGTLKVGSYLRQDTASYLTGVSGTETLFFVGGKVSASTLADAKDMVISEDMLETVRRGTVVEVMEIAGRSFNVGVSPLLGENGAVQAALGNLLDRHEVQSAKGDFLLKLAAIMALLPLMPHSPMVSK